MVATSGHILSDDLLKHCMERAASYDQENKFFTEDFEELKNAGYLNAAVPKELGGLGLNLAEVGQEQRRLAYHAGATALARTVTPRLTSASRANRRGQASFGITSVDDGRIRPSSGQRSGGVTSTRTLPPPPTLLR